MTEEIGLDRLEHWLGREFQIDYWSDDAIHLVGEFIDELDADEWEQLVRRWPERPAVWQRNLADALSGSTQEGRDELLAAMLRAPDELAARNAAYSLGGNREWRPDARQRVDLALVRDRAPENERRIVQELIDR